MSDGTSGLRTVDVRDPHQPGNGGTVAGTSWRLAGVASGGSHAHVVDLHDGPRAFDVSDCSRPHAVGDLAVDAVTGHVALVEASNELNIATDQSPEATADADAAPGQVPQPTPPAPVRSQKVIVVDGPGTATATATPPPTEAPAPGPSLYVPVAERG